MSSLAHGSTERPTLPTTTPLPIVTAEDAVDAQQRLVEAIAERFPDGAMFRADAGVVPGLGQP
ncbi:hypothetical protein, partial [uncultured Aeromicrobium sp.]|uniref:hypothetical protein n=1 Tax=uncultured Aeromicrobium sp. TaxID=337820 RepID=UPI0025D3F106